MSCTTESEDHIVTSSRDHIAELDNISRPDGSAVFCQGKTTVQTGIYGPGPVPIVRDLIDKANLDVIYRPVSGQAGCSEKYVEKSIKNVIENAIMINLHPHTSITANVQVVCDNGGLLSCCINSVCLATMDAGLSMKYLIAAVTCAISNDGKLILDPDLKQEQESKAVLTFVFDSKDKDLVSIQTNGKFSDNELKNSIELCRGHCNKIFEFYKDTALRRLSKEIKFNDVVS